LDGSIIGEGLAKKLKVKPGVYLTILSNTAAGSYNSSDIKISGVVTYSVSEFNSSKVAVNINLAKKLLNENSVDNIIVLLGDASNILQIKKEIEDFISINHLNLVVKSWDEISPYYYQVKNLYNRLFVFLLVLIMVVMILGITNNVMMSVFERFREIGTIRAIGSTKINIATLFVYESFILGVLSWVVGIIFSYLISHIIMRFGIMMPPAPGRTYSYPLNFHILSVYYGYVLLICLLVSVMSGLFPAIKASRTEIIHALKYV
jgi:putative ABC transport system permease protein